MQKSQLQLSSQSQKSKSKSKDKSNQKVSESQKTQVNWPRYDLLLTFLFDCFDFLLTSLLYFSRCILIETNIGFPHGEYMSFPFVTQKNTSQSPCRCRTFLRRPVCGQSGRDGSFGFPHFHGDPAIYLPSTRAENTRVSPTRGLLLLSPSALRPLSGLKPASFLNITCLQYGVT